MNPKLTTSVMVRDFESEEAPRVLEAIARARENIVLTLSVTLGCDEWIDLMLLMELMAEINWPLTIKVEEAEWQRLQEGGLESLKAGWSENLGHRIVTHLGINGWATFRDSFKNGGYGRSFNGGGG